MGPVDYLSRHPNQKGKRVSAYDEEFIVAKLKLISASVFSLNLKPNDSAVHLNKLIQAHDPAHQITPKFEASINAINLISTHATRVHKHHSHLSLAPRNQIANISGNSNISNYAYPALQKPINTSLAKQNTTHCNNLYKIEMNYLSQREKLNSLLLTFRQLGDIPQIFLKVATQKLNQCFLPQII